MKYDDASWHWGGNFPEELPQAAGATHIVMFVVWCFLNGLGNEDFFSYDPNVIGGVSKKAVNPGAWLFDCCDGILLEGMLNDQGNDFASAYYEEGYSTLKCDSL